MTGNPTVNWAKLVFALSETMDLASPALRQHQLRTAYVCWRMGQAAGLGPDRLRRLFTAAALHDIGALAPEEKIRLHEYENAQYESHCAWGEYLFNRVPRLAGAAPIIRHHHTPWGELDGRIDSPDLLDAQILHLADRLERCIRRGGFILHQDETLRRAMAGLAGSEIHPDVVHLFMECSAQTGFWLDLASPGLGALMLRTGPLRVEPMAFEELQGVSELFSIIIDFRSGFTATHCAGVIACARAIGAGAGLAGPELDALLLAANLHDIGKLVIHNEILEKGGALTQAEKQIMKQHPYVTFHLLNQVEGLEQVARIAGYHHERLDGGGYPFGIGAAGLDLPCRIMAVADIFTALAENRPYRSGLDRIEVGTILQSCADRGWLDPDLAGLVIRNMGDVAVAMAASQEVWRERYRQTWREPAMGH